MFEIKGFINFLSVCLFPLWNKQSAMKFLLNIVCEDLNKQGVSGLERLY